MRIRTTNADHGRCVQRTSFSSMKSGRWFQFCCAGILAAAILIIPAASAWGETGPQLVSVPDPFANDTPPDCGRVDSQRFRQRNSPFQPLVAVNPVDPQNIVVAYTLDGQLTQLIRVTKNGGTDWETRFVPGLTICTGGTDTIADDSSLAFSSDGKILYIVSLTGISAAAIQAVVSRSTDGGLNWSQPIRLTENDGLRTHLPSITTDPSHPKTAYVVFGRAEDLGTGAGAGLYFRRTDDGGLHWSQPTNVYEPLTDDGVASGVIAREARVLPTADENLVTVFRRSCHANPCETDPDTGEPLPDNTVFAVVSSNGGTDWDAPVAIGRVTAGPGTNPPALVDGKPDPNPPPYKDRYTPLSFCNLATSVPAAASADGTVYAVISTAHNRDPSVDPSLQYAQSVSLDVYKSPDGISWSLASRLFGARMGLPTIAVASDGTVGMTYYQYQLKGSCANSGLADVWYARSSDQGRSWAEEKLAGPFDPKTSVFLEGVPDTGTPVHEYRQIGDYDDLQPAGPRGFAAVYEMTTCPATADYPGEPGGCNGGLSDIFYSDISNPVPDLKITDIVPSKTKSVRESDKITLTATVTNAGTADAPASSTRFVLDDSTVMGTVATGAIAAGASVAVAVGWDTAGVTGDHTIIATADSEGLVTESDEANNSGRLTVTVQGNKVMNPSFDQPNESGTGPAGWTGTSTESGSASWSAGSVSLTGSGSASLLGGSPRWTSDPIAVSAGESLSLQVSAKAVAASSPASVGLLYLDAGGQVVGSASPIGVPLETDGVATLESTLVVPAGTVQARVELRAFSALDPSPSGTVTFEEVGLFGG
jgi:CARDB protein/BNR repeat protein